MILRACRLPPNGGKHVIKENNMSKLKSLAYKAALPAALSVAAVSASAEGIQDIGTSFAAEVAKLVSIVLAIGMAGVSVVISVAAFGLAFRFVSRIGGRG